MTIVIGQNMVKGNNTFSQMHWLNYLFFNLYNWYYKDGNSKKKTTPWFQAVSGLAIGFMSWICLIYVIYVFFILKQSVIGGNKFIGLAIAIIFYIILHNIYVKDKKYEKIYQEYKHYDSKNKKLGRFIAIMFIVFPLLMAMVLGIIKNG